MSVRFHILQASGVLAGQMRDDLMSVLEQTSQDCSLKLDLADIDVVVMNVPWEVIPRLGIGGLAYSAHQVTVTLDVKHAHLRANFAGAVRAALAHELHHCARAKARGTSHSETYGGSLVAEGLACCYEEEMGQPTPFYAVECQGEALQRFAVKAREHVGAGRWDLPGQPTDWMFGRAGGDAEFPYQCGYSTGYALVRHWLTKRGMTASQAVGVDEAEVLRGWHAGRCDPFAD
ncbi:DUF2268 domain-containing putative Zn-dependent protease [Tropicibacter sp. Alg240-R139]|uniref:DUF2268 domain-containing putative Zn-dependent protease n=1 Tax=Tropicibacter sp. Alg240-R139 TaxID=2305991 RepID=UPI0013E08608|nr:DUF2268 domain-containing putative Zn-dependent protease [Tropicibacter sp. Alg240-R139]